MRELRGVCNAVGRLTLRSTILALTVLAALLRCTTAPPPAAETEAPATAPAMPPATPPFPPSTTPPPIPPPPPERHVLEARIYGHVTEPHTTTPAAHALVTVTLASPACDPVGEPAAINADAHGQYAVTLEAGVGPDRVTCVVVNAALGGATGSTTVPSVRFRTTSATIEPHQFRADVALQAVPPLTREEGEALLDDFAALVNGDHSLEQRIATYIPDGPEALRAALEDYRSLLGENVQAVITGSNITATNQRVEGRLTGSKGRTLSLAVEQDRARVRRLHSSLIHYSMRSRLFVASFSRLVAAGEAERLARLLTADDVDYPVERARRVIARYRPPFDSPGGSYQLMDLDERLNRLTYRLVWHNGPQSSETTVVLGYGDGLLWLADEDV